MVLAALVYDAIWVDELYRVHGTLWDTYLLVLFNSYVNICIYLVLFAHELHMPWYSCVWRHLHDLWWFWCWVWPAKRVEISQWTWQPLRDFITILGKPMLCLYLLDAPLRKFLHILRPWRSKCPFGNRCILVFKLSEMAREREREIYIYI